MSIKKYQLLRLLVVILLSASISMAMSLGLYYLPLAAIAVAMIILTLSRKRVAGILADERDYQLAGDSARYAITIFSSILVIAMLVLMGMNDIDGHFADLASILAFLACYLMLLNSLVFRFLKMKSEREPGESFWLTVKKNKNFFIFLVLVIILGFLAGARLSSPEDFWSCEDGAWVQHGQPAEPAPSGSCSISA